MDGFNRIVVGVAHTGDLTLPTLERQAPLAVPLVGESDRQPRRASQNEAVAQADRRDLDLLMNDDAQDVAPPIVSRSTRWEVRPRGTVSPSRLTLMR